MLIRHFERGGGPGLSGERNPGPMGTSLPVVVRATPFCGDRFEISPSGRNDGKG